MTGDQTIELTRDEALVLGDFLQRWHETGSLAIADDGERAALDNLLALLEASDDGAIFADDYAEQVAAARERLRPQG